MRTVAWLIEELKMFPPDAECWAYEGEVIGIVIQCGDKRGVIHCSEYEYRDSRPSENPWEDKDR